MNQKSRATSPDVRQLGQDSLPQLAFPGGKNQSFRIFLDPEVHSRVAKHSQEDASVEICGVLVGKLARDVEGPFVLISECIRGDAAQNKFAEVTFTHETWAKINEQMDTRFAELAIVGWYHSHPDFGVFLSDRDCFIQQHFFSGPGQVAYVVDPVRKTEGMFIWRDGKPTLAPHYWVGDRLQVSTAAGQEEAGQSTEPVAANPPLAPLAQGPGWLAFAAHGALYLALFLLGFLLAVKLSDLDRRRIEQSALARAWLYLKIRPGLGEELQEVDSDLRDASNLAKTLAREHLKVAPEPKEAEGPWSELLGKLNKSSKHLNAVQETYCLTPDEAALLQALGEARTKEKK